MSCPFLESENPHCSATLSLGHLREAMELCTGDWQQCPVYLELTQAMPLPVGAAELE